MTLEEKLEYHKMVVAVIEKEIKCQNNPKFWEPRDRIKHTYALKKHINEINGLNKVSFMPNEKNWRVGLNYNRGTLCVSFDIHEKNFPNWFYLHSEGAVLRLIEEMENELKIYLDE